MPLTKAERGSVNGRTYSLAKVCFGFKRISLGEAAAGHRPALRAIPTRLAANFRHRHNPRFFYGRVMPRVFSNSAENFAIVSPILAGCWEMLVYMRSATSGL